MTLLESRSPTQERPVVPSSPTEPSPKAARAAALRRTYRIAVIALVVVAVAAGMFALFDGPVANAWYNTRRHQLAAQWSAARPHVGAGNTVALLQIPTLHLNLPVAEGDAPQQLRSGPGHRASTPMPGNVGNSVIVGHGLAWGGPLARIGELKPGDLIAVQTKSSSGPIGVFKVLSVRAVAGDDPAPFARSTDRRLTIVSGTGGRFSNRRIAVTAVSGAVGRVGASSDDRATTSGGSLLLNAQMALVVGALAIAAIAAWRLPRRFRNSTVAVVVTPFLVLALLALLLNLDATLPALR
ncbi:MAG TPA: class E sortase [Acidimicrobiia bacterium]|nr:class E sortase [Acidimicrobiia bacterium]